MHTDGDGLDLDAFFDMGSARVIGLLMGEDGLAAEGVDEGSSAWRVRGRSASANETIVDGIKRKRTSARGTTDHQAELDALLDILLAADHLLMSKHVVSSAHHLDL